MAQGNPEVWFVQAVAQFQISGIKEDTTKFYVIISQLEQRYIREIKDIIKNPPATGKYEKLKQELIKCLSISREHQITQLLSHEELGDRKLSQFLRHLKTLAANEVSDEFLRSMWSSRLPPHIQAIIVSHTIGTLEDVAELADKIYEVVTPAPLQQVASAAAGSSSFDGLVKRLDEMIASRVKTELQQQIAQINLNRRSRSVWRDGYRARRRSRSRTPGKLTRQFIEATDDCQSVTSRLFVTDRKTKVQYLIDTGSDLCVLPRRFLRQSREPADYKLTAANGSVINTYGTLSIHLDLGLRRDFTWNFVVANVNGPIIGADFISHYGLLVYCKNGRLLDNVTTLSTTGIVRGCEQHSIKAISESECPKFNQEHIYEEKIKHISRGDPHCVESIVSHQTLDNSCRPTKVTFDKEAVEQLDDQHYTLIFPKTMKTELQCERQQFINLHGSYLATIPHKCLLRTAEFTIININDRVKGQPLLITEIPHNYDAIDTKEIQHIKLNSINLKSLQPIQDKIIMQQPIKMDHTDTAIYHTTIPLYGALAVAIVIISSYILKRYKLKPKPIKKIPPSQVMTARSHESEDLENSEHQDPRTATFDLKVLK
ncbi:uncharacterized protein LOC101746003 [Bombyx mori]|uniref:uncharacterized protein LOC101746003 n=1 Tax=Bombyx mori TaxID=7091 RepID=UPI002ED04734